MAMSQTPFPPSGTRPVHVNGMGLPCETSVEQGLAMQDYVATRMIRAAGLCDM